MARETKSELIICGPEKVASARCRLIFNFQVWFFCYLLNTSSYPCKHGSGAQIVWTNDINFSNVVGATERQPCLCKCRPVNDVSTFIDVIPADQRGRGCLRLPCYLNDVVYKCDDSLGNNVVVTPERHRYLTSSPALMIDDVTTFIDVIPADQRGRSCRAICWRHVLLCVTSQTNGPETKSNMAAVRRQNAPILA